MSGILVQFQVFNGPNQELTMIGLFSDGQQAQREYNYMDGMWGDWHYITSLKVIIPLKRKDKDEHPR